MNSFVKGKSFKTKLNYLENTHHDQVGWSCKDGSILGNLTILIGLKIDEKTLTKSNRPNEKTNHILTFTCSGKTLTKFSTCSQ